PVEMPRHELCAPHIGIVAKALAERHLDHLIRIYVVVAVETLAASIQLPPIPAVMRLAFVKDAVPILFILADVVENGEIRVAADHEGDWIDVGGGEAHAIESGDVSLEMAVQQVADRAHRKRNLVLVAGESLLLDGAHDSAVDHQRGGRVVPAMDRQ